MAFKRITLRPRILHSPMVKDASKATAIFGGLLEKAEDGFYLFGDIGFIVGSVFFFSKFYDDLGVTGVWLFLIISVINTVLGLHDLYETVHARKLGVLDAERPEVLECTMNVVSAVLFTIGMICELPDLDSDTWQWSDLFSIFGSAALVVSAYFNALGMAADKTETTLSRLSLGFTLMGAVMFTTGATLYLPEISAVAEAYALGTWLYVWGSVLFTISAVLSIVMSFIPPKDEPASTSSV